MEKKTHCDSHERQVEIGENNAIALASISGGVTTVKWVIGLTLPILVTTSIVLLTSIITELKSISKSVSILTSGQQITDAKLDAQQQEISDIKNRLTAIESKRVYR